MPGVKGRSGTRPRYFEKFVHDINYYRERNRLRAVHLINQFLEDPNRPIEQKIPVAVQIVLKDMPTKVEQTQVIAQVPQEMITKLIGLLEQNASKRKVIDSGKVIGRTDDVSISPVSS